MSENTTGQPPAPNPQVYLAIERTLLAWIRTGLAMMGFGFVVARFGLFLRTMHPSQQATAEPGEPSFWFGSALILLGVVTQLMAGWQYYQAIRRLQHGKELSTVHSSTAIVLVALLSLLGVAMTVYLFTVSH